jgi:uncharacterized phage protein (TIGR02218 family)
MDSAVTDLQVCWRLIRLDSLEILGTEYDADIPITTGTYAGTFLADAGITGSDVRSTSDLSVDNLEIVGALVPSTGVDTSDTSDTSLFLLDISPSDIEAGLLDNAEVVTFLVNAKDPDLYQHVLRSGWIGNVKRNAEGRYTTELRGLTQALSQGILRTYGVSCDAELGDARCKVNMASFTHNRTVAVVHSRRYFQIDVALGAAHVIGGRVTFNTGLNAGRSMEIKAYSSMQMELYLPMASDIEAGDEITIYQGCDKSREMCINTYNNILNFRGHGVFVPGDTEILKVGK